MVRFFAFVAAAAALVGCASAPPSESELFGCYRAYDQSVYTELSVCLTAHHTYTSDLRGDIGSWGMAAGSWNYAEGNLQFAPAHETERQQGFLRAATLSTRNGGTMVPLGPSGKPMWDALVKDRHER